MTEEPTTPGLREQLAEALRPVTADGMVPLIKWGSGELTRIAAWQPLDRMLDKLEPVVEAETAPLRAERDQYHAAARHLAQVIRQVAYTWATGQGEFMRTAAAVAALNGIASHVPDRPELRDDLWQRIAGAYEARFENDGHPEDARAAADEAMSVVQPEIDALRAERDRLAAEVERLRAARNRLAVEMTARLAWQRHWKHQAIVANSRLDEETCTCQPDCPAQHAVDPDGEVSGA